MRFLQIFSVLSFLLVIFASSTAVFAQQLNSYSIDADLTRQGTTSIKLVLTFAEPVEKFELLLPIEIVSFNATSSAGAVVCNNQLGEVSLISCNLQLTAERKTLEMEFESPDLVKNLRSSSVFTGDFSVKLPAKNVFAAVRLPEGMVLSQDVPGGSTVPFSNSTSTDGRRITVVWRLADVKKEQPLSFQVFYEPGIEPPSFFTEPPLRLLVLLAIIVGGGIGFVLLQKRKKITEVVFSVLDDYEKRVVSSIEKAGGTINQKRIVLDTNLSKTKVSRVVQKLAERGILEVEKRGRTNIVKYLKKKLGS